MLKTIIGLAIAAIIAAASASSASAQARPDEQSTASKSQTVPEPSYFRWATGADEM